MKINHIKISNILGIQELEFSPEGFNSIEGPNGAGKTSVLKAIRSVFEGGTDATLLRQGAEKGEVVIVLDDGTEARRKLTPKTNTLEFVRDGKKIARPADAIKAITDALSVNPVEFLRAGKKQRASILLDTMPINVDAARLQEISGLQIAEGTTADLALIDKVRATIYDLRTGTNRAIKEKDNTINQIKLAMPDAPGGVEGDEDTLRADLEAATSARDAELRRIETKMEGLRTASLQKQQALKDEAQAQIDTIRAKLQEDIAAETAALTDIQGKAGKQIDLTHQRFQATAQPLQEAIAAIVGNRDAAAKRQQALAMIQQMESEHKELLGDAQWQTGQLEAIDAYRLELLQNLPIPGLEVRDGEVFRDGIPFDSLNTAQQVSIAVELASMRAGELAVMCLDGMELMSSDSLAELRRQADERGLQVFITRVTDDEFGIATA